MYNVHWVKCMLACCKPLLQLNSAVQKGIPSNEEAGLRALGKQMRRQHGNSQRDCSAFAHTMKDRLGDTGINSQHCRQVSPDSSHPECKGKKATEVLGMLSYRTIWPV